MNKQIALGTIAGIVFLFASCKKENTELPVVKPNPVPDGVALDNFFNQNTNELKQIFTVNSGSGGIIVGEKGTRINFNPNSLLDPIGNVVSGNVSVELIEIYDRSTMLLTNKPTMGNLPNGGGLAPLISGGEFYLNVTQNGQQLSMALPTLVELPTSEPSDSMEQFYGVTNPETGDLTWQTVDSSFVTVNPDTSTIYPYYYDMYCFNFGWVNCDYFWNNPNTKTEILVDLPADFNGTNTQVYLLFDDQKTMLSQLFDNNYDGIYGESTFYPEGMPIHIIAVSFIDNKLHYAIQSATVTAGQTITIGSLTEISKTALDDLIKNLP